MSKSQNLSVLLAVILCNNKAKNVYITCPDRSGALAATRLFNEVSAQKNESERASNSITIPKDEMREKIHHERMVEFAFEGLYYFDRLPSFMCIKYRGKPTRVINMNLKNIKITISLCLLGFLSIVNIGCSSRSDTIHLFGSLKSDMEPMLEAPKLSYEIVEKIIKISVQFKPGSEEESGRIWWMFDRYTDGSAAYLMEHFPDENWKDMTFDKNKKVWTAEIERPGNTTSIDFFSTHGKILHRNSKEYRTYISSPYIRIEIEN